MIELIESDNQLQIHLYQKHRQFQINKQIFKSMGCQQSDVMPFINSLVSDDPNPNSNQQRPPPNQSYQHQHPTNSNYPPQNQNQQPQGKTSSMPVPNSQPQIAPSSKKRHNLQPRQVMEAQLNMNDDFLTHHLKYELSLTKHVSKSRILRRQILEHIMLQNYWGNCGAPGINIMAYFQSAQSAWLQRTFLDIWEVGHDQFFKKGVEEKLVRKKISEQYMFQIYELKEFVDAGLGNINAFCPKTRCQLVEFMQLSDDALFNIFKKLKDRYPQTGQTEKIEFPDVPSTKTNLNLLENFPAKCFSDPSNINIQTIYQDVNVMLKKAIQLQDVFKSDMKDILGDDALACPKVNQVIKDGRPEFNACAVRRVFVKWAENLLQSCPDLPLSKAFVKFIKAKSDLANNFFFKSTIQQTSHKIVIDCICYLLEVAKYTLKDNDKRKQFIFNIYDLLRCKIKRNSPQEIVNLLKKMESTTKTKSGQSFSVLRVKNRFKTNNRDLLINFRYGDILVGQAQLCIDDANISKQAKHNYEFCHYIYELERSLFGPTLQLMMQYEDFARPDICVSFAAQDLVQARGNQKIKSCEKTDRKCLQGHEMVSLIGNYFIGDQNDTDKAIPASCNYCDRVTNTSIRYDYCFHCSCFLCRECIGQYKNFNQKTTWLSVQQDNLLINITNANELANQCSQNKSLMILFYLQGSSANLMFKDSLVYHQGKLLMQPGKFIPKIAIANYSNGDVKNICNKYKITSFPTLILFDGSANPVRTLIGYSWLEVPFIYETQKRILNGETTQIALVCSACENQSPLEYKKIEGEEQLICLYCFNNNKPINIPEQYATVGGFCAEGHYRCIACCYAALDIPSTYKDPTATTYFSTPAINLKLAKCPKNHNTHLTKVNSFGSFQYSCYKCKQSRFFDDEIGIGFCDECKVGLCPKCMGYPELTLVEQKASPDLAVHFAESTAQQGCLCVCKRHFKKVYNTRSLSFQEINKKQWNCYLCQRPNDQGLLHIGCFACPSFEDKTSIEVCLPCAKKSKMLVRQVQEKVQQQFSFFVCKKNHQLLKSSKNYDGNLTFVCGLCPKRYYGSTERLYCKTCNINYCYGCIQKLWNANPPTCNQLCLNKHKLKLSYKNDTLKFCDSCCEVIKKQHFYCPEGCGFDLCPKCSHKQEQVTSHFDDFLKGIGVYGDDDQQQQPANLYNTQEQQDDNDGSFNLDFGNFGDYF